MMPPKSPASSLDCPADSTSSSSTPTPRSQRRATPSDPRRAKRRSSRCHPACLPMSRPCCACRCRPHTANLHTLSATPIRQFKSRCDSSAPSALVPSNAKDARAGGGHLARHIASVPLGAVGLRRFSQDPTRGLVARIGHRPRLLQASPLLVCAQTSQCPRLHSCPRPCADPVSVGRVQHFQATEVVDRHP